ncbi:hypothetical protein SCLCIDRAFT_33316 [Scleroderma citrinum Foug A]|uniref:Uncharacterized protein n=1 Tax=Scleroderma citrinum Foug A TaxID=1036808 RepID=A0A0C2YPG9_9AGAM|nr:hypothetical protein SCLCIDRAFT_33316 [Scleroderma citrinum Foug A]
MSRSQQEKEELQRRIRGLTTILHKFAVRKWPSEQPRYYSQAQSFLHHFTTLLTGGGEYARDAKRVFAVTGSIDPGQPVRALVVAQNPRSESPVGSISLTQVKKSHRSLDEMVESPLNPDLIGHIADTWSALSAIDRHATDYTQKVQSLEIFFLSRSIREFTELWEDTWLCGGKQLAVVIAQWKTNRPEITPRWVDSGWLDAEFSDKTKHDWSVILVALLSSVDKAIEDLKRTEKERENVRREMETLNTCCRMLYYFVSWKAEIVPDLLTKTNMVDGMTETSMPMRTPSAADEVVIDDELTARQPDLGESKGNKSLPDLLRNIEIALVEVPRSPPSVLTLGEISDEFFIRFPDMIRNREIVLETLEWRCSDKRRHSDNNPDMFFGCIHAEAMLMGLLNYYNCYSAHAGQGVGIQNPQIMQHIVQPEVAEAGEAVIAVSKRCCWCCEWLGKNLESQFTLPGTHGMMYPWDPPNVGVSESVLKKLEGELWDQLYRVVLKSVEPLWTSSTGLPEVYQSAPKSLKLPQEFLSLYK